MLDFDGLADQRDACGDVPNALGQALAWQRVGSGAWHPSRPLLLPILHCHDTHRRCAPRTAFPSAVAV